MQTLSRPVRRALALSLLLAIAAAIVTSTVLPYLAAVDVLTEQTQQTRTLVSRLSEANALPEPDPTDWVKLLTEASKRDFISGDSQTIRLANVQSAVVQSLAADSLKPRSIRNLPPRQRAGLTLVGVQVQIGASLDQLQSMLGRLDRHQPRLLIEDLQVTRTAQGTVQTEGTGRLLDVRLDVFGIEPVVQVAKVQP